MWLLLVCNSVWTTLAMNSWRSVCLCHQSTVIKRVPPLLATFFSFIAFCLLIKKKCFLDRSLPTLMSPDIIMLSQLEQRNQKERKRKASNGLFRDSVF